MTEYHFCHDSVTIFQMQECTAYNYTPADIFQENMPHHKVERLEHHLNQKISQ